MRFGSDVTYVAFVHTVTSIPRPFDLQNFRKNFIEQRNNMRGKMASRTSMDLRHTVFDAPWFLAGTFHRQGVEDIG